MEKTIQNKEESLQIPQQYLCPISTEIMKDPVIAGDGITYQRQSIERWFEKSNYSPFTGKKISHKTFITNQGLKNAIQNFKKSMPSIQKEKYINLEQAFKMREKQMNNYLKKNSKKGALLQKQDENEYLTAKQLLRELKISRTSLLETQKMLAEEQEKNMTLQTNVKELTEELKISKQKQCKCKINNKKNQDKSQQVIQNKQAKIDQIILIKNQSFEKNKFKLVIQAQQAKIDQISLIQKQVAEKNKSQQAIQKKQTKINQISLIEKQNYKENKTMQVIYKQQVKINQTSLIEKQKSEERQKNIKKYSKQIQLYVKQIIKRNLKQQKQIKLRFIKLTADHIGCMKQLINLTKLYAFQIHSCNVGDREIKQFFDNQKNFQFSSMKILCLYNNNITGQGIKYLIDAQDSLPYLILLHLNDNNRIRKKGINFLGKSRLIHRLSALHIQNTFDGDKQKDCVKILFQSSELFFRLTYLAISKNNIGDKGLSDLSQKIFPNLSTLQISSNKISLQGIKSLTKNRKMLICLQRLYLENNDLCSQSIKVLTSLKQMFTKLSKLCLSNNPNIGDQGINHLIQQQGLNSFPSLNVLDANQCNVTNCEYKKNRIRQKYPKIQAVNLS